jgi:hypothetical protein
MSQQPRWKEKYGLLKEYTTANPEIYIDTREVSIPGHLRDEFYNRFDSIRETIVEDCFNLLNLDVETLSVNYQKAENELTGLLGEKPIVLPTDLLSFLHNPKEGLIRALYNRLFELVQGKLTEEEFENLAAGDLEFTVTDLYNLGYEAWSALVIMRMLEPDRIYGVGLDEDFEPVVTDLVEIAFGRQFHHVAKRIPEFILHSRKLDKHVAVKMPLAREVDTYYIPFEPPVKPRKRTGDTSYVLDSRVMFLAIVEDLKKIPVFADIHARTIQSPDLTIEFLTAQNIADPVAVAEVSRRIEIMKPKLGGCIVVINPTPGAGPAVPEDKLETFAVGLDRSGFQPVVDKLA